MANINIEKVKGIIFDYGGTIDTAHANHWSEVIFDAYTDAGVLIAKEQFRDAYVYAERELARTLHILPHHNFADLLDIKIKIEMQWLAGQSIVPADFVDTKAPRIARLCYEAARNAIEHARPVLQTLSQHYPLVLVSNFYGNIHAVLTDFDLLHFFTKIVESAVEGVRKPDPELFNRGVKALGLKADEVLVIGDSYKKDIVPAETLGCQVLWIKGKAWSAEEDARFHPNIITDLSEILALLLLPQ